MLPMFNFMFIILCKFSSSKYSINVCMFIGKEMKWLMIKHLGIQ